MIIANMPEAKVATTDGSHIVTTYDTNSTGDAYVYDGQFIIRDWGDFIISQVDGLEEALKFLDYLQNHDPDVAARYKAWTVANRMKGDKDNVKGT